MTTIRYHHKGHCYAKGVLFRAGKKGGFGLPNLLWYYQVAQLTQISVIYSRAIKPDWVHMECQAVPRFTLDYLMWCPPKKCPAIMALTLFHSYSLLDSLKGHTELISQIRPLALLFHNLQFIPGMNIRDFQWWTRGCTELDTFSISLAHSPFITALAN